DGFRWHANEPEPGRFDFSSARAMVRASVEAGVEVIWDLLHFGWPDHVDVFAPEFPQRLEAFAREAARMLREEGVEAPMVAPVNEISFLSFAAGEAGFFNPFAHGRGNEIKAQFVRAAIRASRAVREISPEARLVHTDPIIHVRPRPDRPEDAERAEGHRLSQYESWDMIAGRIRPELGGSPDLLDILGVNYYVHNQWYVPGGHGSMILPSSQEYRPVWEMLVETHERYRRPLFIAETGIEDRVRPTWLAYISHEAREAIRRGVELHGICLYPIVNHPGWDDDRHCHNGVWDYADERGERPIYVPLAREIVRQAALLERLEDPAFAASDTAPDRKVLDPVAIEVAEATETAREG
ncbi:MAG TPA: beta-glucosidase, partial [Candidatus Eisenbacteria bacterium]|nr:beta-glucosidase [Candidatus Eisenbacteria bacterium]